MTSWHTFLIGISSFIFAFIAMIRRTKTISKLQTKFIVMDSVGEVTTWQDGVGKVNLLPFPEPWWRSKPKRDWHVFSRDTLSVGDTVKVIGTNEDLSELEVAKIDSGSVQQMADVESTGFSFKLWNWVVAAFTLWLLSVLVTNDFISFYLIHASAITIACGVGSSYSKVKGWTWIRQLAIWSFLILMTLLFTAFMYFFL